MAELAARGTEGTAPEGPVQTFDSFPVRVAVWRRENKSDNGPAAYYDVTTTRTYRVGEEWKHTASLRYEDLLPACELLRQAWTWISAAKREDRAS